MMNPIASRPVSQTAAQPTPQASRGSAALPALLAGLGGAFRHWRLMLLAWLAGLLPAAIAALPVYGLFNSALGWNPDAGRIVHGSDIAPLADALMNLGNDSGAAFAGIGEGMTSALLIALLVSPWLSGMLVASLRERRILGFGELWTGGWREYGRQFRLLLVAIVPATLVAMIAAAAGFWARHGSDTAILQAVGQQRMHWAMALVAILALLGWMGIGCGRAAFAADPALRSALLAWLRGLRLMLKRPFAALLIVLVTLLLGGGIALLLQAGALNPGAASLWVLLLAQVAVLVTWWTRIARLSALTAITPLPTVAPAPPLPAAPMPASTQAAAS